MKQRGAAIMLLAMTASASAADMADNFDAPALDIARWSKAQIRDDQIEFLPEARCGAGAIQISTSDGDQGLACDIKGCQRAELRTSVTYRSNYGDEAWYAFSFKVDANVPKTGSLRTVISQWKAPNDESPFLAQRFDNGVFHITVQDGEKSRRTVASAEGDPEALDTAQDYLATLDPRDDRAVSVAQSIQTLQQLRHDQPQFGLFSQQMTGALDSTDGEAPDARALSDALGLKDSGLLSAVRTLAYASDLPEYLGPSGITITHDSTKPLPDPRKDWVDMIYRIRTGRPDNTFGRVGDGEIDIWANGEKIATVRGSIGARLTAPVDLRGYFKFGIYRKPIPGIFRFQFDEYSQASTKAGLAKLCPRA